MDDTNSVVVFKNDDEVYPHLLNVVVNNSMSSQMITPNEQNSCIGSKYQGYHLVSAPYENSLWQ